MKAQGESQELIAAIELLAHPVLFQAVRFSLRDGGLRI
jgi:hypothetical protein